jgi:hypothetical protein
VMRMVGKNQLNGFFQATLLLLIHVCTRRGGSGQEYGLHAYENAGSPLIP